MSFLSPNDAKTTASEAVNRAIGRTHAQMKGWTKLMQPEHNLTPLHATVTFMKTLLPWILLVAWAGSAHAKGGAKSRVPSSGHAWIPVLHSSRPAALLSQYVDNSPSLGTCFQGSSMWEAFPQEGCKQLRCLWSETEHSNIDLWLAPFSPISHGLLSLKGSCSHPRGGQTKQSPEGPSEIAFIITMYNDGPTTAQCLLELFRTAGEVSSAEFILVDDGSTGDVSAAIETGRQLQHLFNASFKYVRSQNVKGYGPANNLGVQLTQASYVALINSDTFVVKGWLQPLLDTISSSNRTGMVGPLLVGHSNLVTQAGGMISASGVASNLYSGTAADRLPTTMRRQTKVDYLSTVATVLRRDVYLKLRGFDTAYQQSYWNDVDLAMRAHQAGLDVVLQPLSVVFHQEGSNPESTTATESGQAEQERVIKMNGDIFQDRWQETLASEHCPGTDNADIDAQGPMSPRILYVEEGWPQPERDAGSVRLDFIFRILLRDGYSITYATTSHFSYTQPLYQTEMRFIGVETLLEMDPEQWPLTISDGPAIQCRFDVIFVAKKSVAERVLPVLRKGCPSTPIIFDTIDIQFVRESRAKMVELHQARNETAQPANTSVAGVIKWLEKPNNDNQAMMTFRDAELKIVREADLTVVVSTEEKYILQRYLPDANVHVVSLIMPHTPRLPAACEHRRGILFVGSFGHQPNGQAIEHLFDEVLPYLQSKMPAMQQNGFHIHIVGSGNPARVQALLDRHNEMVTLHVNLSTALLELLLARVRVFVAPLLVGGGVKGKVLQALTHGVPVVAYNVAVEGIGARHGRDVFVAQNADEFAQYVAQLLTDCTAWTRLSRGGQEVIRRGYMQEKAQQDVRKLLEAAGMQQPSGVQHRCDLL